MSSKKVSMLVRCCLVLAAALLSLTYFFPLWRIGLQAPQYPEGLRLEIWTNALKGDVTTINILNHYIGMHQIKAGEFPELALFPWLMGIFAALALLFAAWGQKGAVRLWCLALGLFAIAALGDFYIWEYKYGHELNPEAAIIMEDMEYQPPLIGEKTLLNISASSWPDIAGYAFGGAVFCALLGFIFTFRTGSTGAPAKPSGGAGGRAQVGAVSTLLVLLVMMAGSLAAGCTKSRSGPEEIVYGQDACASCRMVIADRRFGAELLTTKGKAFKFDSLECVDNYLRANQALSAELYVVDFENPGRFLRSDQARFVINPLLKSPMGAHAAAVAGDGSTMEKGLGLQKGGVTLLSWADLRRYLQDPATRRLP